MLKTLSRANTGSESTSSPHAENSTRPSVHEARRPSLANLSLRLTRSKKSHSGPDCWQEHSSQVGQFFFSLPTEIQALVLSYLEIADIFALRLTCHTAVSILNDSASVITRSILNDIAPPTDAEHIQRLYPAPSPCPNTDHLLQLHYRHHIVNRTVHIIINFIQVKIYMFARPNQIGNFTPCRTRLLAALYKPAWTIYHFLECYRRLLVDSHPSHPVSKFWHCSSCSDALEELVKSYAPRELIPALHLHQLLLIHLSQSTRPPTSVGTFERRLRGWNRMSPSEEQLASIVVLGGMPWLSRISVMKGSYNQRLEVISTFLSRVGSSANQYRIAFGAAEDGTNVMTIPDKRHSPPTSRSASVSARPTAEVDFMSELDVPYASITEDVLDSLPAMKEGLILDLMERVRAEQLVSDEYPLDRPYDWVKAVMEGNEREFLTRFGWLEESRDDPPTRE